MNNITIRTATADDLPVLLQFEQGIIRDERPFDETLKEEKINYYDLKQMLASADIELKVAEVDGELIGCGYARIENSKVYLKHREHCWLGFMYVKPEYRRQGVNQKIIGALQEWSIERNIHEFTLDVYFHNVPAIKSYEKMGFVSLMTSMRMKK